jgi:hypothetical protein
MGGNLTSGAQVDVGKPLQQLGCATFDEPRPPVDDEVLLEPRRLDLGALDRQRHARIAGDVSELPLIPKVRRDDLVAVQSDPDAGDLRGAVGVQRDEVGQRVGLDQRARALSGSFMR